MSKLKNRFVGGAVLRRQDKMPHKPKINEDSKGCQVDTLVRLPKLVGEWADKKFKESTPETIMKHLKREIKELDKCNSDPHEIANVCGIDGVYCV